MTTHKIYDNTKWMWEADPCGDPRKVERRAEEIIVGIAPPARTGTPHVLQVCVLVVCLLV